MQLDVSVRHTAAPGRDEDSARHNAVTTQPGPAHEDHRPERAPSGSNIPESEQLFRTAFERAVIGIAHISPGGRWLRFNQRLCDLLGYDRDELAALTVQDVTYPDDLAACGEYFQHLLTGEINEYAMDKRYVRKDGTLVWTHIAVSLVRTPEGVPDFTITMIQDISERKRLEQERAPLLEQERAARLEAEATNARLSALQALTARALPPLALHDLLRELLGRVPAVMGVDNIAILLLDDDGQTLTLRAIRGEEVGAVGLTKIPLGCGVAGRIAASREPLIVDDTFTNDMVYPWHRETLRSVVGVPLLAEGHLVGVVLVSSVTLRRFTDADVQLLQPAADRIGLAVGRAHLYAGEQDARRRVEAALTRAQASEAQASEHAKQLHTILETMTDGVAVTDAEGRYLQTNRAYRELLAAHRLPGFNATLPAERGRLLELRDSATGAPLPPEYIPTARALRGEVVTGPSADIRARAFDGRELEVNAGSAPLRDREGHLVGAVCVIHDQTERKRLEREREEARANELATREVNRRMEQFLATAAHDTRTPLTATLGYVELAQRQFQRLASAVGSDRPDLARQVEAVRGRLDEVGHGAERLSRLVEVLFDTAAIRSGRLELHQAPCDLAALVGEQVAEQRMAAPYRTIRLHTPEAGRFIPVIPVAADADRIGQVVANYLTNALKYAPPEHPVEVSVEMPMALGGGWARVAVRDRGPGLPEAEQERVWEPFHRAQGITAQGGKQSGVHGGSLGLGLHICKAIVEAHGGRVGVESAVGEGSTFWFTLPLAQAAGAAAA